MYKWMGQCAIPGTASQLTIINVSTDVRDTQGATPQQHLGTHPVKHLFQFMILTCSSAQASKTTPFLQGTYCIRDNNHMDLLQNPMCQQLQENLVICTLYNPDLQRDRIIKQ